MELCVLCFFFPIPLKFCAKKIHRLSLYLSALPFLFLWNRKARPSNGFGFPQKYHPFPKTIGRSQFHFARKESGLYGKFLKLCALSMEMFQFGHFPSKNDSSL